MHLILCKSLAPYIITSSLELNHLHRTAGSETTATTLSCVTYYLLRYPTVYRKLQQEIRSAFKAYHEINASSTTNLEYLHAVALEGMRMYAPLPFALPRVVPEGGDTVDGHFLPAGVSGKEKPLDLKRNIKDTDGFISDHCIN